MKNNNVIDTAMILAAGFGRRLRPYTDDCPKPLVKAAEEPLIHYAISALNDVGVKRIIINSHYLADKIRAYIDKVRSDYDIEFHVLHEDPVLETGGGIKAALKTINRDAFYVLSGDSWVVDGGSGPALKTLQADWDADKMDLLLLLQDNIKMTLTKGAGDYDIAADNKAVRSLNKTGQYVWTSARITKSSLFDNSPDGAFSFLEIMDRAEKDGCLYASVHDGAWHHISTPEDLDNVNEFYKKEVDLKKTSHGS